jgi:hypothetical protein
MATIDGDTGTNLSGIGYRRIRRFRCRHLQGPELHRVGIGQGFRVYSDVSPFSDQGVVPTKVSDRPMIEMAHQSVWPMESLGQTSGSEPQPLLVCQYCGFVRDDESWQCERPAAWVAMATYRKKSILRLRDVPFVHTYCPNCLPRIQANKLNLRNLATTAPAHKSIRTPLRVRIDRGWLTFIKGMVERKRR